MAIIYLDPDDEITSAAARIRAATDARIAVVVPYGSRLATSRINFRLLAREAAEHGRTVEIVAPDAAARALAGSAGLVTHPSVSAFEAAAGGGSAAAGGGGADPGPSGTGAASGDPAGIGAATGASARRGVPIRGPQRSRVEDTAAMPIPSPRDASPPVPVVGRPRPARGRRAVLTLLVVLVLAAVVLGAAAFLYLPSATVVLVPKSEAVGPVSFVVTADPSITAPDPAGLRVPAKTYTFDLQASDTFQATGKKVTDTPATGSVLFQSCNTASAVTIPQGTTVSTASGVQFTTQANLRLPKATAKPAFFCPTGSVDITAAVAGTDGNVAAGQIAVARCSVCDPAIVYVTNPTATTGGTHTETPLVQQADVDAAVKALDDKLVAALDARIAQPTGVPSGTRLFAETKKLGTVTTSVDPATLVNQEVAQFQLGASATGSVVGVDPAPIAGMAGDRLQAKVKDGWSLVDGSEKVDVGDPIVTAGSVTFPATVRGRETRTIDRAALLARIQGLGLPQARTVLAEYGEATVTAWPDWVTTIPTSPGRISLTITAGSTPGASGGPSSSSAPGQSPGSSAP